MLSLHPRGYTSDYVIYEWYLAADVADLDPDPVCPGPEVAASLRICNLLMLLDVISRVFLKTTLRTSVPGKVYEIQVQKHVKLSQTLVVGPVELSSLSRT